MYKKIRENYGGRKRGFALACADSTHENVPPFSPSSPGLERRAIVSPGRHPNLKKRASIDAYGDQSRSNSFDSRNEIRLRGIRQPAMGVFAQSAGLE
jgi:hypothetical protein